MNALIWLNHKLRQSPTAFLGFCFLLTAFAIGYCQFRGEQIENSEPELIYAEITSINMRPSVRSSTLDISLLMEDDTTRSVKARLEIAAHCRVGQKIALHQRGINLQIAPEMCSSAEQATN